MNDFTKEELKLIYISCAEHADSGWKNITPYFLNKVRTLIDNYENLQGLICSYPMDENDSEAYKDFLIEQIPCRVCGYLHTGFTCEEYLTE
jgi:hypothetical protein